eukprot:EG_transcript_43270
MDMGTCPYPMPAGSRSAPPCLAGLGVLDFGFATMKLHLAAKTKKGTCPAGLAGLAPYLPLELAVGQILRCDPAPRLLVLTWMLGTPGGSGLFPTPVFSPSLLLSIC